MGSSSSEVLVPQTEKITLLEFLEHNLGVSCRGNADMEGVRVPQPRQRLNLEVLGEFKEEDVHRLVEQYYMHHFGFRHDDQLFLSEKDRVALNIAVTQCEYLMLVAVSAMALPY